MARVPDPEALSKISLFRGMPRRELERLAPLLRERTFAGGSAVMTAEQPGEAVYTILSGGAKVHLLRPDGTEVILAVLGPGEVVGEMSLADSLGRSADVTTLEETTFLWMDRATFRSTLADSPVLTQNVTRVLSRRLRLTNAHLLSLAALDVNGRVASQLLALAREYGEETGAGTRIPLRLTQSDLAALTGASRVRVNQALGYYRKRGAVSVGEDGRLIVCEPEALGRRTR